MPRIWKPTIGITGVKSAGARRCRDEMDLVRATQRAERQHAARTQQAAWRGPKTVLVKQGGELKGKDGTLDIAGPIIATTTTNADAFLLNGVQRGNGYFNRIGNKLRMKSVRLRGQFNYTYKDQATTGNIDEQVVRMVVIWDKRPGAAIPTYDEVFQESDEAGTQTANFLSDVKFEHTTRFQVLRDVVQRMPVNYFPRAVGGTQDRNTVKVPFDEFVKLKGREVQLDGTANPMTSANITTGALFIYFRASAGVANTADVSIAQSHYRLRYYD